MLQHAILSRLQLIQPRSQRLPAALATALRHSVQALSAIALLLVASAAAVNASDGNGSEGDAAAQEVAGDYALPDLDGRLHSLVALRGQWVVINFWATWCAPCIHEMPELEAFHQQNQGEATVWGVTFEETKVEDIRRFVEKLEVSYPILGNGGEPSNPFQRVRVLPTTLLIDPAGVLQKSIEGPVTAQQLSAAIDALSS